MLLPIMMDNGGSGSEGRTDMLELVVPGVSVVPLCCVSKCPGTRHRTPTPSQRTFVCQPPLLPGRCEVEHAKSLKYSQSGKAFYDCGHLQ